MKKTKDFKKVFRMYISTLILPIVLVGGIALVILLGSVSEQAKELNRKIVQQFVNSIDSETSYILRNSAWIIDSDIVGLFLAETFENSEELNFYAWKNIQMLQSHTKAEFVEGMAVYSIKNDILVNDASVYSRQAYYERYIQKTGITYVEFEQALRSESSLHFYLVPKQTAEVEPKSDFLFCRSIIKGGQTEGMLIMTINGGRLLDAVVDSKKKQEYQFAVFDKSGDCFLATDKCPQDAVAFGKSKKAPGVYRYKSDTILVQKSNQTGYLYIFCLSSNTYTSGTASMALMFCEFLLIVLAVSTVIAKRKTDKINRRFMNFRKENTLLSNQLAAYMEDVRKNNMIKKLQNYFDPWGNPVNYDFSFQYAISRVVVIYVILPEEYIFMDFDDNRQRLEAFNEEVSRTVFQEGCMCEYARLEDNLYVYVFNYQTQERWDDLEKTFWDTLTEYQIQSYVGIGDPVLEIEKISQSYEEAISAMHHAKDIHLTEAVKYQDLAVSCEITRYSSKKEESLLRAISRGMEEVVESLFCEIYEDNYQEESPGLPQRLIFDLISTLYRAIGEITEEKADKLQKYDRICKQLVRMHTLEAFEVLKEVSLDLAKHNKEVDKQALVREKMLQYIEEMYLNQDFCLQMLADEMDMNYYYLSRLFTEYIGESFISYVTAKRLEKAKTYLIETDMAVEEIAFSVGFVRSSSFINIFKKYYGITPGKFRQSNK